MDNYETFCIMNRDSKITDKRVAIELLKTTPEVWGFLSEELQNDVEVILYHQPSEYVCKYVWGEHSRSGLGFVVDGVILCEPGFYAEYEKNKGICEDSGEYIKNEVVYPEGVIDPKLKEVYGNLQRKFNCNCEFSHRPFDDFPDSKMSSFTVADYCKYSFDKHDIDTFVQEALQEYAQLLGEKQLRR